MRKSVGQRILEKEIANFQFAVQRQTEEKPLHSKTDAGAFFLFTSR